MCQQPYGHMISFYETLEETVAREVMEEAGIRVKNIQYYKSQPWGVVDDLLSVNKYKNYQPIPSNIHNV